MPAARLSYIPWFPHDWLLDSRAGMLPPDQRAYYFDLLMHCYISDDGTIPGDDESLRYLARSRPEADLKQCLALLKRVPETGRYTHPRVLIELRRMRELRDAKANAGRKGGSRSKRTSNKQTSSKPQADLNHDGSRAKLAEQSSSRAEHYASAPPEGARSREMSTPQSEPPPSPAGSAPAARAGGAAPTRPASAAVPEGPVAFEPGYATRLANQLAEELAAELGVSVESLNEPRRQPPAPAEPDPPPKPVPTREQRAAAVRAQAAAILASTSPEERAAVEARLAEQDAAENPVVELPAAAPGGES